MAPITYGSSPVWAPLNRDESSCDICDESFPTDAGLTDFEDKCDKLPKDAGTEL